MQSVVLTMRHIAQGHRKCCWESMKCDDKVNHQRMTQNMFEISCDEFRGLDEQRIPTPWP